MFDYERKRKSHFGEYVRAKKFKIRVRERNFSIAPNKAIFPNLIGKNFKGQDIELDTALAIYIVYASGKIVGICGCVSCDTFTIKGHLFCYNCADDQDHEDTNSRDLKYEEAIYNGFSHTAASLLAFIDERILVCN